MVWMEGILNASYGLGTKAVSLTSSRGTGACRLLSSEQRNISSYSYSCALELNIRESLEASVLGSACNWFSGGKACASARRECKLVWRLSPHVLFGSLSVEVQCMH